MRELYGDHPALDLINTVVQQHGQAVDTWHSDADVAAWLQATGLAAGASALPGLLAAARTLREMVRTLVGRRKLGAPLALDALNALLAQGSRHLQLQEDGNGKLALVARYAADTPQHLLTPVAEAAAQLLADGDFQLVRQCEDAHCTLWFLDRTKSHRRRWCSMAQCGNRNKVASFRQRQQAGQD